MPVRKNDGHAGEIEQPDPLVVRGEDPGEDAFVLARSIVEVRSHKDSVYGAPRFFFVVTIRKIKKETSVRTMTVPTTLRILNTYVFFSGS